MGKLLAFYENPVTVTLLAFYAIFAKLLGYPHPTTRAGVASDGRRRATRHPVRRRERGEGDTRLRNSLLTLTNRTNGT